MDGSIPRRLTGTLKDEFCKLSPFGPSVTEAVARTGGRGEGRDSQWLTRNLPGTDA